MSGTSSPWKQCHVLPSRYDISDYNPGGVQWGGVLNRLPPRRVFSFSSEEMKKREKARRQGRMIPEEILEMRREFDAEQREMVKGLRVDKTAKMVGRLTGERRL